MFEMEEFVTIPLTRELAEARSQFLLRQIESEKNQGKTDKLLGLLDEWFAMEDYTVNDFLR